MFLAFRVRPACFLSVGLRHRGRHALFPPKGEEEKQCKGRAELHAPMSLAAPTLARQDPHARMFTARATTRPIVTSEISDCMSISIFAIGLSGIVSVGLNALALVNDT
jgi:hypothetical protein